MLQSAWQSLTSPQQSSLLRHFLADGVRNRAIVFEPLDRLDCENDGDFTAFWGENAGKRLNLRLFRWISEWRTAFWCLDVMSCRFLPLCLERAKSNAFVTIPVLLQAQLFEIETVRPHFYTISISKSRENQPFGVTSCMEIMRRPWFSAESHALWKMVLISLYCAFRSSWSCSAPYEPWHQGLARMRMA